MQQSPRSYRRLQLYWCGWSCLVAPSKRNFHNTIYCRWQPWQGMANHRLQRRPCAIPPHFLVCLVVQPASDLIARGQPLCQRLVLIPIMDLWSAPEEAEVPLPLWPCDSVSSTETHPSWSWRKRGRTRMVWWVDREQERRKKIRLLCEASWWRRVPACWVLRPGGLPGRVAPGLQKTNKRTQSWKRLLATWGHNEGGAVWELWWGSHRHPSHSPIISIHSKIRLSLPPHVLSPFISWTTFCGLNKTAAASHSSNNSATCQSSERRGLSSMVTAMPTRLVVRLISSTAVGLTPVPQTRWNCRLQFRLQFLLRRRPWDCSDTATVAAGSVGETDNFLRPQCRRTDSIASTRYWLQTSLCMSERGMRYSGLWWWFISFSKQRLAPRGTRTCPSTESPGYHSGN